MSAIITPLSLHFAMFKCGHHISLQDDEINGSGNSHKNIFWANITCNIVNGKRLKKCKN